jgi:hypothetical protein
MGLEGRITPYSYLNQGKAYLEEDIDAGIYLDTHKLLPKPVSIQNNYMDGMCCIRHHSYYRYENIAVEKRNLHEETSGQKASGGNDKHIVYNERRHDLWKIKKG